jgi:putative transposase
VCAGDDGYKFMIHDRDSIYSRDLASSLRTLGLQVLKTPYRSPQANAFCERLIGSARRECLDFMIPLNEDHIRRILKEWTMHYNKARPHSSLGPGIPERTVTKAELQDSRHRIPAECRIIVKPILGGLHHEYGLQKRGRVRMFCFCGAQRIRDARE